MALVVTLSLLVLVTIATMAFFARATANRAVEASRANQVLAAQLSDTAQDYVIGRFLGEMTNNANAFSASGVTLYQVTNAAGMKPQKSLSAGISSVDATNTFASLVRQSVPSADPAASNDGTTTASQNGRMIGTNRWNAPILNFGAGFSSANQLPNWIYVNRDGTATGTASTNAIGRFAYNVYDVGGLLDANVAGNPGLSGTDLQTIKGTLAGADLSVIPGIGTAAQATAFINWRNPGLTGSSYATAVTNAANDGFLSFSSKQLTSRQDLIRLAKTGTAGISPEALPYLSHGSSTVNAPSWGPTKNASEMGAANNGTGNIFAYKDNATNTSSTNRFLPSVRVKSSFTRRDGRQATIGEPLILTRFPLSRLAWLGKDGPVAPGTASTIQRDFGLVWDNPNKRWDYVGHVGSTIQTSIKTLDQVATDNREPNFFELLKAGILSGSVGQGAFDDNGTIGMATHPAYSRSSGNSSRASRLGDYQIIQIGINLVDQQDPDDIPTAVLFDSGLPSGPFIGTENLPYIYKFFTRMYRPESTFDLGGDIQPTYRPYIRGWLVPEIWNPSGNASAAAPMPMRIRQTSGTMRIFTKDRKNASGNNISGASPYAGGSRFSLPASTSGQNQVVSFTSGPSFASPLVLSGTGNSSAEGNFSGSGFNWSGFWLGDIKDPDGNIPGTTAAMISELAPVAGFDPLLVSDWITAKSHYGFGPYFDANVIIELQVNAGGSDWRTVQRLQGPNAQSGGSSFYFFDWQGLDLTETDRVTTTSGSHALSFSDPRTQRVGMSVLDNLYQTRISGTRFLGTLRSPFCLDRNNANPSSGGRFVRAPGSIPYAAPGSGTWTEPAYFLASLCENLPTSNARVGDADGLLRPGDGRLATAAGYDALGDGANSTAARPIILNRAFRSPAEMGYAFRDQPWKTLDFFSDASADSGLLDLFCIEENKAPVSAGLVNLNSASAPILQSLLIGSDTGTAGSELLSSSQALTLAEALRAAIATSPLIHPGELASASSTLTSGFPSARDAAVKSRREVVSRSLAAVGRTRNWGLLIDIVAQSGRFSANPSPSATTFIVEGESRKWISASLDRFTATPVSIQQENVSE